jgi:hypothetical protein
MTPHQALRIVEVAALAGSADEKTTKAIDRLWELVVTGKL